MRRAKIINYISTLKYSFLQIIFGFSLISKWLLHKICTNNIELYNVLQYIYIKSTTLFYEGRISFVLQIHIPFQSTSNYNLYMCQRQSPVFMFKFPTDLSYTERKCREILMKHDLNVKNTYDCYTSDHILCLGFVYFICQRIF